MAAIERPPRTNEQQKEQPDSPGRWSFIGYALFKGAHNVKDTVVEIDKPQLYDIVDEAGKLNVSEDGSIYHGNVEWLGWWVKLENN